MYQLVDLWCLAPSLSGSALEGLRLQPYSARRCGNCLRNDANSTPITHRQDCRHALLYARQSAQGTKSIASRWRRGHSHEPWTAANRNYHSCMGRGEVPIALLSLNSSLPFESAPWRARS